MEKKAKKEVYNPLCRGCIEYCKQPVWVEILKCPDYRTNQKMR